LREGAEAAFAHWFLLALIALAADCEFAQFADVSAERLLFVS
jgi:hypothetical protein